MKTHKRILLVEDDRRLGKLIRSYLAKQGIDVFTNEFNLFWLLASNAGRIMERSTI